MSKALDFDSERLKSSDGIAISKQKLINHLNKLGYSKRKQKVFFKKFKTWDYGFFFKFLDKEVFFSPKGKGINAFSESEEDLLLANGFVLKEQQDFKIRFSNFLYSELQATTEERLVLLGLFLDFFAEKMYFYTHVVEESAIETYREMKLAVREIEKKNLDFFVPLVTEYVWGWWD